MNHWTEDEENFCGRHWYYRYMKLAGESCLCETSTAFLNFRQSLRLSSGLPSSLKHSSKNVN